MVSALRQQRREVWSPRSLSIAQLAISMVVISLLQFSVHHLLHSLSYLLSVCRVYQTNFPSPTLAAKLKMVVNDVSSALNAHRVLRVGIIGCGEISQVAHIPNINNMSDKFVTTFLCDISEQALTHCERKVLPKPPKITRNAEELCASEDVDVVLIASANAFHVPQAILALKYDKYCLLEKPAALNYRDADSLIQAEALSKGKVFVGYMRRYATSFLEAVKEVGGLKEIQYARVRDIIGRNSTFVEQSGTFPRKFTDVAKADIDELTFRDDEVVEHALSAEFGVEVTPQSKDMLRVLGG
jgi:hypothetical protein